MTQILRYKWNTMLDIWHLRVYHICTLSLEMFFNALGSLTGILTFVSNVRCVWHFLIFNLLWQLLTCICIVLPLLTQIFVTFLDVWLRFYSVYENVMSFAGHNVMLNLAHSWTPYCILLVCNVAGQNVCPCLNFNARHLNICKACPMCSTNFVFT